MPEKARSNLLATPRFPLQITFRDMSHSDAVEEHVRRRARKLDRFYGRIVACRVAVAMPHRHQRHGKRYQVRIDITVPGHELVVARNPPESERQEDLHAAIDTAFDDAERRLEDYAQKLRGDVKRRNGASHGVVTRLFRDDGYGFLEGEDGVEVYFHENSVLGAHFDELRVGTEVRYAEEQGDKGPQASTVHVRRRGAR